MFSKALRQPSLMRLPMSRSSVFARPFAAQVGQESTSSTAALAKSKPFFVQNEDGVRIPVFSHTLTSEKSRPSSLPVLSGLFKQQKFDRRKIFLPAPVVKHLHQNLSIVVKKPVNIYFFNLIQLVNRTYKRFLLTEWLKSKEKALTTVIAPPFNFYHSVDIMQATLIAKLPDLLARFIAYQFRRSKKHAQLVRLIKFLIFSHSVLMQKVGVKGIAVKLSGRISKRRGINRAKATMIKFGTLPLTTIDSRIEYAMDTGHSSSGAVGVKVWIHH
eukprot:GILI01006405.1.p1 GENE.GILI01006405.1~~GILI01006405.1.p1  ORF type:complete len:272 (+),score=62.73 GILI01006405.1:72-887(+)